MSNQAQVRRLAEQIRASGNLLVFTGAGISTDSGIPDFRGPDGIWKKWRPVYYQEFVADHEARVRHWRYKASGWKGFRDARPNAGHRALVQLEKLGYLETLVTQNIDGLHQLAGQSPERVVELHGTNRLVECLTCGKRTDPDSVYEEFENSGDPPQCPCGGWLKPATVSFGQAMPRELLEQAFEAARRAQVVISVGSTLEVEPAASVPYTAKQSGASYAIINRGPTAHDSIADLRYEAGASQVLEELVGFLKARDAGR